MAIATESRTKRTRCVRRALGAAVTAGLVALVVAVGGHSGANDAAGAAQPVAPVADEAPGYAVEDFDYPGADQVLAEQGFTLKRGDGHIVLADCASEGELMKVKAFEGGLKTVCFRVTGNSGWLTMEMPAVYSIMGSAGYTTQVDMTTEGEERSWDLEGGEYTAVGQSSDSQLREWALVEIRTSR